MANKKKFLSKEQILAAQGKTNQIWLLLDIFMCHINIIRKWAKLYKLFAGHKNQSGKGIPKFLKGT
jgi:hypothetical protein